MSWDGKERRNSEEWGYVKATVEQNTESLSELKEMFKEHIAHESKQSEEFRTKMQELHDDVNVYKTVIKVLKALGWSAAFILAFKFGDIPDLWSDVDD